MSRELRRIMTAALATALLILGATVDRASSREIRERLETSAGETVAGRLESTDSGIVFRPEGQGAPIPLEEASEVRFEGQGPDQSLGVPPFRVVLGPFGRISGRLVSVDEKAIQLDGGTDAAPWTVRRQGARALLQRPGEVQVLRDGFETLDESRWSSRVGTPELANEPRRIGEHALRLPADGSAISVRLAEPVGSGRLEIAYFDDGRIVPGRHGSVDLTFQNGEAEPTTIRVVLGWSEETLAVDSPGGTRLAVQGLIRRPGWHRLTVRFDGDETHLSVDGDELAHGPGPDDPLTEIRLAAGPKGEGEEAAPPELAATLDDLSLVRFVEPVETLEVEPRLDEIRLASGDQLFGRVQRADAESVRAEVDGQPVNLPWTEVTALTFERSAAQAEPIAGVWVRLDWLSGPGHDPRDLDRAEGAITAIDAEGLTLEVPFIGRLTIPRDRLRRLEPIGRSRRLVIDPNPRHLGDRLTDDLDPPQPESGPLTIPFEWNEPVEGPASLAIDVVQAIGETGTLVYSEQVRRGHLRTKIFLNDQPLEDLNQFIPSSNETPERIRVPIPPGRLQKGRNTVRFEQTGTPEEPTKRDNLGLLGLAIETPLDPAQP